MPEVKPTPAGFNYNLREYNKALKKWRYHNEPSYCANDWVSSKLNYAANRGRRLFNNRVRHMEAIAEQWPEWARTGDMVESIQWFYDEARRLTKETGILHVVDHIESLQQSHAMGLHVPWNLQVITTGDNTRKRQCQKA
jgi:hypothetical protein